MSAANKVTAVVDLMVQDMAPKEGLPPTEKKKLSDEFFLNGPVSRRVAVLDFDPDTGVLIPGAAWELKPGRVEGRYIIAPNDKQAFVQVNVFGIVHKTISMFEASGR
jgi:hypothetical protein